LIEFVDELLHTLVVCALHSEASQHRNQL
jgi:hypothetical protein